ncbi:putative NADPH:quinone reductase, Zn-dependent alcohol dehydrogenases superfamily [Bradyrhizobium sp. ORS 285]|nr:putative NADPH:quinone reductase, Zn-dependent alcohol dehydrogenases superfamily [Bradyrhizobium sp. ORS 285]SMX57962.1 putative NADPH:quinone reductase, Zn-dependent alcohol dehydrogenases superfamily [Bradyrhizobium sp. ORS 285]
MHAVSIHSFGGPSELVLDDMPMPQPGEGDVLVRVRAASVNPVDYKTRSGGYPAVKQEQLPKVLRRDVAGLVERVGDTVTRFRTSDAVYAMLDREVGGYAEFVRVHEADAAKTPDGIDFVKAAAVPLAALTAWQGLFDHGHLKAGQRVLIHGGSGGVGHFAIQFAKNAGAWVATTVSDVDVEFVRKLGADKAIDYRNEQFEDAVQDIDLVFDLIGGDTQDRSWTVLKRGGALISTLQKPDQDEAERRGVRATNYMAEPSGAQLAEIARLIETGKVTVVIDSTFPLQDVGKAHEHMEHDHVHGKVVLQVAGKRAH